jgi:hypothetical protein
MITTITVAVFGLALASAAQAMPLGSIHQQDGMFTQVREGCGPGHSRQWCLHGQGSDSTSPPLLAMEWKRLRSVGMTEPSRRT